MMKIKFILSSIVLSTIVLVSLSTLIFDKPTGDRLELTENSTVPESETNNDPTLDLEYQVDPSDIYEIAVIEDNTLTSTTKDNVLTTEEVEWLKFMREEEKLARDVYRKLGEEWNLPIFFNIAESEQSHTDAIATLLKKYSITDPVADDTVGVFENSEINNLYNELVLAGKGSVLDALVIGATIEDLDIKDLAKALEVNNKNDIETTYKNLQKGSRNHLRAFAKQISALGGDYQPKYITNQDYQNIINTEPERGRIN